MRCPAFVCDGAGDIHTEALAGAVFFWYDIARAIGPVGGILAGIWCRAVPQLERAQLDQVRGGSAAFGDVGFGFLQLEIVKGAKSAGVALDGIDPVPAAGGGSVAHLQPGPALVHVPGGLEIQKLTGSKYLAGVVPELEDHAAVLPVAGDAHGVGPGGEGVADAAREINPLIHTSVAASAGGGDLSAVDVGFHKGVASVGFHGGADLGDAVAERGIDQGALLGHGGSPGIPGGAGLLQAAVVQEVLGQIAGSSRTGEAVDISGIWERPVLKCAKAANVRPPCDAEGDGRELVLGVYINIINLYYIIICISGKIQLELITLSYSSFIIF